MILFVKTLPHLATITPAALLARPAQAQDKVLRIAMTTANLPRTLGRPEQGYERNRAAARPLYGAPTQWDLSKPDAPSGLI